MRIAIGNDHAAVALKCEIVAHLESRGIDVTNVGTDGEDSFDYPVAAERVARLVCAGEVDGGVLICGTGVGISIAANKVAGIRACVCSEPVTAAFSKRHNNANVVCFGARIVGAEAAKAIVDAWLDATHEGGRHQRRVDMIAALERGESLEAQNHSEAGMAEGCLIEPV